MDMLQTSDECTNEDTRVVIANNDTHMEGCPPGRREVEVRRPPPFPFEKTTNSALLSLTAFVLSLCFKRRRAPGETKFVPRMLSDVPSVWAMIVLCRYSLSGAAFLHGRWVLSYLPGLDTSSILLIDEHEAILNITFVPSHLHSFEGNTYIVRRYLRNIKIRSLIYINKYYEGISALYFTSRAGRDFTWTR